MSDESPPSRPRPPAADADGLLIAPVECPACEATVYVQVAWDAAAEAFVQVADEPVTCDTHT